MIFIFALAIPIARAQLAEPLRPINIIFDSGIVADADH
jgi:hypothetical protein